MRWWSELATACAYIGAVIGAGFASGQELVQFFFILGDQALGSLLLVTWLFSTGGFLLRALACRLGTTSYRDFLDAFLGEGSRVADGVLMAFLFGILVIMFAGAGAVAQEHLGFPAWAGNTAAAGLTLVTVVARSRGVLLVNTLLIPVLVIYLALIGLCNFHSTPIKPLPPSSPFLVPNWILNSFLYVTYNMVGPIVLFTSLPPHQGGKWGAFAGGLILGILALLLVVALGGLGQEEVTSPVPVLALVNRLPPLWQSLYAFNLWVAMVTTAITSAFGLVERLARGGYLKPTWISFLIISLALPLSGLGFTRLVGYIYPLFGYLILFLLLGSGLWRCLKKLRRPR